MVWAEEIILYKKNIICLHKYIFTTTLVFYPAILLPSKIATDLQFFLSE